MILYPDINPVAFSVFGFDVRWYGVIMACAIFVGILCADRLILKKYPKEFRETFLDCIPHVVIVAIFGARLFYVIGDFDFYLKNPFEIVMINHGGLSLYGAIFFGLLAIFVFSKFKHFSFFKFTDIIALVMPLCQSIGRWGNFINQEAYGAPYDGLIKLYIDENHRIAKYNDVQFYHPAFLYESVLDLALFFILIAIFLRHKNISAGVITALYLIFYSIVRILVENVRIDSISTIFSMPAATFISSIILFLGIILLFSRHSFNH